MSQRSFDAARFADAHVDMPDGAFWALAEEKGLYPEDFIEHFNDEGTDEDDNNETA